MRGGPIFLFLLAAAAGCAHPSQGFENDLGTGHGGDGGVHGGDGGGNGKLDMNPGSCLGKDLKNDPMNCGFCGNVCALKNTAKDACTNGACTVGMCSPGYYDVNMMATDGCECQRDAASNSATAMCTGATPAGAVADAPASMITLTGNIVPAGESDWYQLQGLDTPDADGSCDPYDLKIAFTMDGNPGSQFRFDLIYDDCSTPATCAGMGEMPSGLTDYDFSANGATDGGECPCYNTTTMPGAHKCTDNSQTLRMRVYRVMSAPLSCDSYKILISNGM